MSTGLIILACVLPFAVLLLLWFVLNGLGRDIYSEPEKLKREIRAAHGEMPETAEERRLDRLAWFGWIPRPSTVAGWVILLVVLGAIMGVIALMVWHVIIFTFVVGMFAGPVFDWLLPVFLMLAAIAIIGRLAGYGALWKMAASGAILCIALAICFWYEGNTLYRENQQSSFSNQTAENVIGFNPMTISAVARVDQAPWYLMPPSTPLDAPTRVIVCANPGPGLDTYVVHINHDSQRTLTTDDLLSGDLTAMQFVGNRAITVWAKTVSRNADPKTWCT